ncbi:hypothetical protein KDJ02_gp49 [Arthrobacter phage Litotes]|uniref:dATP/dGTP diphosphohydrolase N-terminal domain-containing protein n=1 Tax=Arthrobacter phage Litotes TaxID=2499008 RepID=A0A3S9UEM7_9CAUD|nr:hypothetical protein KDJ02_gp49 [Arthrobacter phage Litotes]AZS08770.1 hypothetical protein SEA_LITOTES_49 [Arthrobacter phage Litotes]
MVEYVIHHALNCASLIPLAEGNEQYPCSCGAVEHERRLNEEAKIPLEQVGDLEETEQGLSGLFKLHGVAMTQEMYASINQQRLDALSFPEGEVRSVSSAGAEKGVKEARFDLIPVGPLEQLAIHFGRGAQKYEPHNWRKGYEFNKGYAALQRHANAWWAGENLDPEMGTSHLAAVAFHALALLELMETHPEMDDRFIL